ncbi:MAG: DUF3667 domain-containing protein [Pseudomonadota bacterium]
MIKKRCLNCGADLRGIYCHRCGQRDLNARRSSITFIADTLDAIFSFEARLWRTLGSLAVFPGRITRDYMDGRRARYVPPIRLYLGATLLLFLVLQLTDVAIFNIRISDEERARIAQVEEAVTTARARSLTQEVTYEDALAEEITARFGGEGGEGTEAPQIFDLSGASFEVFVPAPPPETISGIFNEEVIQQIMKVDLQDEDEKSQEFSRNLMTGINRVMSDPRAFNRLINEYLPRLLIIQLPLFSLLLGLLYVRRKLVLVGHLLFSLHYHVFMFFLLMAMFTLVALTDGRFGGWPMAGAFFIVTSIYLTVALKIYSGQGWIKSVVKSFVAGFGYGILLNISFTLLIMIASWDYISFI